MAQTDEATPIELTVIPINGGKSAAILGQPKAEYEYRGGPHDGGTLIHGEVFVCVTVERLGKHMGTYWPREAYYHHGLRKRVGLLHWEET